MSQAATQSQSLYGPSQLDLYFRLLNSRNLGGFGQLQQAASQIEVAEKQEILRGLPPLPLTHDEVLTLLTTPSPTTTTKATAKPTTTTPSSNPFSVNPIPEIPPIPEDRIGGTYDEDGNFVSNLITSERRKAQGTRNYQVQNQADGYLQAQRRQVRQQPAAYPLLVFRPKPQPTNRDPYYNNILLEIEEYDDFLDQAEAYKQKYPGAQVVNPYFSLPEGKLPSLATYTSK
ncbi:unnamed protein product [Caenorhabditis auriculariae]|uniref:Uncharacterized protein n=1 Tax=Caenorhabditis auriculariae TaxID=2777116 RepID=A0A8S1H0Z1_9PELO|nr:unnamed protein product [Caenorhabditis auriculariae]